MCIRDSILSTASDELGHDWESEKTVDQEPTCLAVGSKSTHCSRCSETKDSEEIAKLDHSYSDEWTVDKEATCKEAGSKSHHCTTPGCTEKSDVTEIEKTDDHIYPEEWTIDEEATCTKVGSKSKTCSVRCV